MSRLVFNVAKEAAPMAAIREFGKAVSGKDYVLRPGGYCVVRDASGRVAVVATPRGAFLIGGGQEAGETPRQALLREAREECGCTLKIGKRLAVADELLYAKEERTYLRKRGTFFAAGVLDQDTALAVEPDHALVWLPLEEALGRLVHESHRWALRTGARRAKKKAIQSPEPTSMSVTPPAGRLRKASPGETQEARQP